MSSSRCGEKKKATWAAASLPWSGVKTTTREKSSPEKGLWANARGTASVIVRPHHLCGVETPTSILCAGLLGVATGNDESYRPLYDMVVTTLTARKTGELINCEHDPTFHASLIPAAALSSRGPLPAHLSTGRRLKQDIPAGAILTQEMFDIPVDSFLFELRKKQDAHFGTP